MRKYIPLITLIFLLRFFSSPLLAGTIPVTINYQGYLTDNMGIPLADDNYDLEFKLYDVPTGGIELWTETYNEGNQVMVTNGRFSVRLGTLSPFNDLGIDFKKQYYLEIKVGNSAPYEPRLNFDAVPYSMIAHNVVDGGITSAMLDPNLKDLLDNKVIKNPTISSDTRTKITYDDKGLVTGGADLEESDIPALTATKITGGTFSPDRIPNLSASKISSGVFDADRIPLLTQSNVESLSTDLINKITKNEDIIADTKTKITYDAKGLVTAGADLAASDIPELDTDKITSGEFNADRIPALDSSKITTGTLVHERGGLENDISSYNGLVKISGGATTQVPISSAGETLLADADASAQRTTLGLGTIATQVADNVNIDGGAIDGTPIGANSADTGAFTTLNTSGAMTMTNTTESTSTTTGALKVAGGIGIAKNVNIGGDASVAGAVSVASDKAFYFGDPTTDGTWRIIRVGNDLVFQCRESTAWVDKLKINP